MLFYGPYDVWYENFIQISCPVVLLLSQPQCSYEQGHIVVWMLPSELRRSAGLHAASCVRGMGTLRVNSWKLSKLANVCMHMHIHVCSIYICIYIYIYIYICVGRLVCFSLHGILLFCCSHLCYPICCFRFSLSWFLFASITGHRRWLWSALCKYMYSLLETIRGTAASNDS